MWARLFCCTLVLFVHILTLVGVASTHFPPNHVFAPNNLQGSLQNQQSFQINPSPYNKGIMGSVEKEEKMKKIGSKPPRCDHKCYGCMPCEAVQVPTTTSHAHVGLLYTNYEPEGWKCKCGPTFYTP